MPERRSLINRLGFPSEGMEAVAPRIEQASQGRSFDSTRAQLRAEQGHAIRKDCRRLHRADRTARAVGRFHRRQREFAEYAWAARLGIVGKMSELFEAIHEHAAKLPHPPPVLVKISPDLERNELFRVCENVLALGIEGIVACNTTIMRESVGVSSPHPGGLSGQPILIRTRELIRDIFTHTRGQIPIIGVGGDRQRRGCVAAHPRRRLARGALHRAGLRGPGPDRQNKIGTGGLAPSRRISFY